MRTRYFKMVGCSVEECTFEEWSNGGAPKTLAKDQLEHGFWISTIFIGVDISDEEPPKVFETCVFTPEGDELKKEKVGCWFEALMCHKEVVRQLGEKGNES